MPALTQPFEAYEKPGLVVSYPLAAVKVFKGALIGVNAAGFASAMAHGTADLKFIGVATETVDNAAGAAGDKRVNVAKAGSFVLKAASGFTPAQSNVGSEVHANTDWEVQVSASGLTNAYKVGRITGLETTSTGNVGVRVRIDNHVN